jgi:ribosomal protein S18 acetylase RimI-like enzyme
MATLVPMTEPEFEAFLEELIPAYAKDKVDSGEWTDAEALALSARGARDLLPQGLATPGHHLFTVRDASGAVRVGELWFAEQERAGKRIAYVYDIAIRPEYHRLGHATRAFAALEEEVRRRGLAGIALHVFGHNAPAIALYQRLGFHPTDLNLFKPVT